MEEDEGDVRVTVDPSASHYHAGENATFTISFTNTRHTPTPQTPRPPMSRTMSDGQSGAYARSKGHRRAVSSISEARMARPPTSPGLRRPTPPVPPKYSPLASTSSSTSPKATRQGLIGQRRLENGNRTHPLRSLSVAITSHSAFRELVDAQDEDDDVVALNGSGTPTTPTHSRPSPPRRSRTTAGIPLSHPHARKQSAALDGTFQLTSSVSQRLPSTPSISTFSTSLAPITESSSFDSVVPSPLGPGRDLRAGLGHGSSRYTPELSLQAATPPHSLPTPSPSQSYPDTPSTPSPTHTEGSALILLAHAQLTGTLALEPPSAALAATWRAAEVGTGRRVVGGGRVGIGVPRPRARPRAASGVGAWLGLASPGSDGATRSSMGLGGLVSAGSSTASLASAPPDSPSTRPFNGRRGHQRATSMASFIPGMASISALLSPFGEEESGESALGGRVGTNGMGAVNGSVALDGMGSGATVEEGVYPILETQPSVLAVDLTLQPGETRKYAYTITLPSALPPSFRGKYFKLTYHLVVGTTRPDAHSDAGQLRRVIRVPIRMYNHVAVGRMPRPYDLMWPLARRREGAMLVGSVEEGNGIGLGLGELGKGPLSLSKSPEKGKITRKELEIYARRLVASAPDPLAAGISKLRLSAPNGVGADTYEDDEGANMSCRDAVEVVTRHSKKVSYDIAKDGKTVAVITFVKAMYRLGETLLGAIEFNNPDMEGRVLKYSVTLESTESLALHTPAPQTRKHAEHHAALTPAIQRAAFSLDIPSDGTPSFSLTATETNSLPNGSAGSGRWAPPNGHAPMLNGNGVVKSKTALEGGLQWRVRVALVVCMASRTRHVVRDGLGNEWGEAWRAGELAPAGPASSKSAIASGGEGWGSFFGRWAGEDESIEEDVKETEEEKWVKLKLETLECELPITVFPGSTAYQPNGFDTWA
ncbi:Rgp1-domain-containing protein [Ceratobasidium sp. AG-I]|nr:Rgp1-domain-containing protein [Ceratobasidium sp. AG-I]